MLKKGVLISSYFTAKKLALLKTSSKSKTPLLNLSLKKSKITTRRSRSCLKMSIKSKKGMMNSWGIFEKRNISFGKKEN